MQLAPLAVDVIDFWFAPGEGVTAASSRAEWFRKDPAFDATIRERYADAMAAGIAGAYGEWCTIAKGSLARIILLDQFPRNAFRGTRDAFAGDPGALATAEDAVERGFDEALCPRERWFVYLPFEHSEAQEHQDRAVALFTKLATQTGLAEPLAWAERHRDVIRRFGRFPHRNGILGRVSTPDEVSFLRERGARF